MFILGSRVNWQNIMVFAKDSNGLAGMSKDNY